MADLPWSRRRLSCLLVSVIMMGFMMPVMFVMMVMATARMRGRYPGFVSIAFVQAVGDAFVSRHKIQLHRSQHARGRSLALWAGGRKFELRHGSVLFEGAAGLAEVSVKRHLSVLWFLEREGGRRRQPL